MFFKFIKNLLKNFNILQIFLKSYKIYIKFITFNF